MERERERERERGFCSHAHTSNSLISNIRTSPKSSPRRCAPGELAVSSCELAARVRGRKQPYTYTHTHLLSVSTLQSRLGM